MSELLLASARSLLLHPFLTGYVLQALLAVLALKLRVCESVSVTSAQFRKLVSKVSIQAPRNPFPPFRMGSSCGQYVKMQIIPKGFYIAAVYDWIELAVCRSLPVIT